MPGANEIPEELKKLYEEWCSFTDCERANFLKTRYIPSTVWEVMSAHERELVEGVTKELNEHIKRLSLVWWKERGYIQVYSKDNLKFSLQLEP